MIIKHETTIVKDGKEIVAWKGECETEAITELAVFFSVLAKQVMENLNPPQTYTTDAK